MITSDNSTFRSMENCLLRLDDVTAIRVTQSLRATMFEFLLRFPDIAVFVDETYVYLCPTQIAIEKFHSMLVRREQRLNKRYSEIKREYENTVSLMEAVNKYVRS